MESESKLFPTLTKRRGKLKIFVGAAPGVGKTYTLLRYAKTLQQQGLDVVVGWCDAHGRSETLRLLDGLEIFPRLSLEYHGASFEEVDVMGLIRRSPQVVVIDELAHSNVPGSRHAKRYMDVEDLLAAGINVLSAVNVQHLESAFHEASVIIGVPVREIVPTTFLEQADLEMVDVTPQALRHRLQDGAIYPPAQITTALNHLFQVRTLSMLRELALREVADDVDQQLHRLQGRDLALGAMSVVVRETILVSVSSPIRAVRLIETGARIAKRMKADLIVLTVVDGSESLEAATESVNAAEPLHTLKTLVDQHQGTLVVEASQDRSLGATICAVATRYHVTQIVVGQTRRKRRWMLNWGDDLITYLLRHLRSIDLRIVGWRD
jgi:two-component system sensor histidine kinase KdpD